MWFRKNKKQKSKIEGNDLFVTLVEMAMEGDSTGDMVRRIINLSDTERLMVVATMTNQLRQNNATEDLIQAFSLLQNRDIVHKIRNIIYDEQ